MKHLFLNKKIVTTVIIAIIVLLFFGILIYTDASFSKHVEGAAEFQMTTAKKFEYENLFSYTGAVQEFVVPKDGSYKIELWGASATGTSSSSGYVSGEISLIKDETLYIYVGVQTGGCNPYYNCSVAFNGGGQGGYFNASNAKYRVAGGGGATDVRLVSGAWNDQTSLRSRIMVAAGSGSGDSYAIAGSAGGLNGYNGSRGTSGSGSAAGTGGTQTSGAGFGVGGTGVISVPASCNCNDGYGGGNGYYGGTGGRGGVATCPSTSGAGGGGSSFISGHLGCNAVNESGVHTGQANHYSGKIFENTKMIDGKGYVWTSVRGAYEQMPNPLGGLYGTGSGHKGNGYAKITYIS